MCADFTIQYQKIILVNTITNLIRKFLSIGKLSNHGGSYKNV